MNNRQSILGSLVVALVFPIGEAAVLAQTPSQAGGDNGQAKDDVSQLKDDVSQLAAQIKALQEQLKTWHPRSTNG